MTWKTFSLTKKRWTSNILLNLPTDGVGICSNQESLILQSLSKPPNMRFFGHWTVEVQMATIWYAGWFTGVMFLYQPKKCVIKAEIPQIDHRFVLLDPPKMGNLMIPGLWTTIFYNKVKIHHPKGTTIFLMLADFQGLCSRISWNTLEVQLASIFHITGVLILPT